MEIIKKIIRIKDKIKKSTFLNKASFSRVAGNMKHIIITFIVYAASIILITLITGNFNNNFLPNFLVNANSSILDFFVLGVVLYYFEYQRQNKESISELLEDLENLAVHEHVELKIKKIKIIRQLNAKSVYNIQVPRINLSSLSTIKYLKFNGAEISGLNISQSSMRDCEFINCSIQGMSIENGKMKNVKFINCRLKNFKAPNTRLLNVRFDGCYLEGADFSQSEMKSNIITNCDLKNAKYSEADMRSVNLSNSDNVNAQQLSEAKNLDYIICSDEIKESIRAERKDVKLSGKDTKQGNRTPT